MDTMFLSQTASPPSYGTVPFFPAPAPQEVDLSEVYDDGYQVPGFQDTFEGTAPLPTEVFLPDGQDRFEPSHAPDLELIPREHAPVQSQRAQVPVSKPQSKTRLSVKPLAQNNNSSCGQTSVAMTVNYLTGKKLQDHDIDARYRFDLKGALQAETRDLGLNWKERMFAPTGGTHKQRRQAMDKSWELIEKRLKLKRPVIIGMGGPTFSPSGRGHILTIVGIEGNTVYVNDPADGTRKKFTKQQFENSPGHPQGKFVFYADRERLPTR